MPTEPTNFECPWDLAAVVAEVANNGSDLATPAPFSYKRMSLQVDVDTDGNGPLDTSTLAGGLSMTSLHLSAPSSSGDCQLALLEGKTCQLPQGFAPLGNVSPVQDPEIEHCDRAAAKLPPAGADLMAPVCILGATRNSQQGKEDCLARGEVGENLYSLSDRSRDSENASTSSSSDSETCNSSTAPLTPTSMLRRTAIKCHERRGAQPGQV
ncbi:hypothetical protein NDU88_000839 [Pleurodeles waltl]|uniref:Uncharacterized protein n=1 Tax=Pleurodeles waltl TaxID=8319 RepID=A0AAV7VZP0_PLEWA|nr:hypothetical protein NDU88_000839 [Pleurodeles waltl]